MAMAKKHDAYCWECCAVKTTLKCSTCVRSFHVGCIVKDENTSDNTTSKWLDGWSCPVCIIMNASTSTEMELDRIPLIVDRVWTTDYVDLNKRKRPIKGMKRNHRKSIVRIEEDVFSMSEVIVNPISLSTINEKTNAYKSLYEFLTDVHWIVHNCEVLFGANHDKTRRAKDLLETVEAEVDSVKKCLQCHVNANAKATRFRWFSMVCDRPHLIIWAYRKSFKNFWPAKMMAINDGQTNQVNVRFFGRFHKHENVPVEKCFLYSEKNPGIVRLANSNGRMKKEMLAANKEVDLYINNLRETYGGFRFAEPRTPFVLAKFDDYVRDLMSTATTSSNRKLPKPKKDGKSDTKLVAAVNSGAGSDRSVQAAAIENLWNYLELQPLIKVEQTNDENSNDELLKSDEMRVFTSNDCETPDHESLTRDKHLESSSTADDEQMDSTDDQNFDDSLKQFSSDVGRICEEFKNRVQNSEKNRKTIIKTLKAKNSKFLNENKRLTIELKNQIEALKKTHNEEVTKLKDEHQKLKEAYELLEKNDQQQTQTVMECVQEYSVNIEEAKKNKYCDGCGNSKPLDIYICSPNCQRICWERSITDN